jgi:hypothetical protein
VLGSEVSGQAQFNVYFHTYECSCKCGGITKWFGTYWLPSSGYIGWYRFQDNKTNSNITLAVINYVSQALESKMTLAF